MMNWRRSACFAGPAFAAGLVACPSDEGGSASAGSMMESACAAVEACEGAMGRMQCEQIFEPLVPPTGCLEEVEAASCEVHASEAPAYTNTCFPSCTTPGQRCSGDGLITVCDDLDGELRELRLDCQKVCALQELAFTGMCGTAFEGIERSTEDVCWCRGQGGLVGLGASSTKSEPERLMSLLEENPCAAYVVVAVMVQEIAGCEDTLQVTQQARCQAAYERCQADLQGYLVCAVESPLDSWDCNAAGQVDVADCETERITAETCLGEPL